MGRARWVLGLPAAAVWAAMVAVALQWHVRPAYGDGDCGTVWTAVTRYAGDPRCDGPGRAALAAALLLPFALVAVPVSVTWLARRLLRGRRE